MFDWLIGAVGNWVKSWTSKPAAPKPTSKPTIPVSKNYGFQGSTYNPQKTKAATYYQAPTYNPQKTASTRYYQPAAPARYVQPAATAAQIAQRARAYAAAVAAEKARKAEIERQRVIKVKTAEHKGRLSVFTNKFKGRLSVAKNFMDKRAIRMMANKGRWNEYFDATGKPWGGGKYDDKTASPGMRAAYEQMKSAFSLTDSIYNADGTINEKALAELEKAAKNRFRVTAKDLVDQRRKGSIFDEDAGRAFGWKSQADLQWRIGSYEKKQKSYLAERGKREQAWREAQKAGNVELANRLASELNAFNSRAVRNLVWNGAALEGLSKGYGQAASTPYRSKIANGIVATDNFVKKYVGGTIGKAFSLFEAPNRGFTTAAVKLSGALGNKQHFVHKNDGSKVAVPTNQSWGQTYNQTNDARGLNRKNITIKSEDAFLKNVYAKLKPAQPYDQWKREKGTAFYKDYARKAKWGDSVDNFFADPLFALGGVKPIFQAGKILTGRAAGRIPVPTTGWKGKVADGVKWLGKEHKTAPVRAVEAHTAYRKAVADATQKYWPAYQKLAGQIKGSSVDFKVVDDLAKLSDKEAAVLQRMRGLDKFARRDTLWLRAKPVERQKLLDIHQRWQGIAENMRLADDVRSTRFKGNYYSHGWSPTQGKDGYDFRKFRKNRHTLKASDLHAAQMERLFMSNLEEAGQQVKGVPTLKADAQKLFDEFDTELSGARNDWSKAVDRAKFKRDAPRKALGLFGNAWKAAVLPLRPAWYVNNAAYNQMAGLIAAGPRFLAEQAKLLKPGNLTKARRDFPQVGNKIGQYHNGGWLYRAASALEDNARYAAFNAKRKQRYSDDDALNETNKWLIDYSTKNWERPLKTVMPFWAWTKGIGKATARMPFDRPAATQAFSTYDNLTEREKNKLPEDQRKFYPGNYVGKDDVGNPKFNNLPWLVWSKNNIENVGLNPLISAASEWAQNKDRYGNPLGPKSMLAALGDRFPQVGLYNDFKNGAKSIVKSFSQRGSDGYALTKQDTKDTTGRFSKSLARYMGFSESRTFDRNDYNKRQKERKFYDEWFAHDWKKEFKDDWQGQVNAQTALAKKYGYSLDHVYDTLFRKRDTPTTTAIKDKKDEARKWADKFWTDYQKQPYGTRSRWANEKMKEVIDSKIIEDNTFINDKLPKWYSAENSIKYSKPSTAVQYKGKWFKSVDSLARYKRYEQYKSTGYWKDGRRFKSAESYQRYQRYLAYKRGDYNGSRTYSGSRRQSPYQYEGKFFKSAESMEKYKEGSFWKKYYATDDYDERQKLLDKNPQYRAFDMPETAEEWREFKKQNKARQFARASQLPDWMAAYENYKALTPKRVKFAPSKKIVWKG